MYSEEKGFDLQRILAVIEENDFWGHPGGEKNSSGPLGSQRC